MIKVVVLIFLATQALATFPVKCRGPNESYDECGPSCGGDSCTAIDYLLPCNQSCHAGCFCDCGFFRNSKGICVPPQECNGLSNVEYPKFCIGHQCCGDFQYYTKSNDCRNECPQNGTAGVCIPEVVPGCFCLPGYKRNPQSLECVPINQCPGHEPCPPFETREGCVSKCESCDFPVAEARGYPKACLLEFQTNSSAPTQKLLKGTECVLNKCHCISGYFRNSAKQCVSEKQCLIEDGINSSTFDP